MATVTSPAVTTEFPAVTDLGNESATNSSGIVFNPDLARIEIIVQAVILVLATVGNGTVLLVLFLKKSKLSRMNLMIVHLSLADLFVAFFNVLPQLLWDVTGVFQGGDVLCRLVKYFQVVAMYASSYVLVSTAIDRWMAICHPLTAHTWGHRKLHTMVGVAWILSLLFSVPQLFIFSYKEREDLPGVKDCWATFKPFWTLQMYITWITVVIYIIPLCLLVIFYGSISYVVWRSTRGKEAPRAERKFTSNNPRRSEVSKKASHHSVEGLRLMSAEPRHSENPRAHVSGGMSRAKMKTIKLTVTVIICYILCWSPFFIAQMWGAWDPNAPFQGVGFVIVLLLASLNSCTNPWIYLAFSGVVCAALKKSSLKAPQQTLQHPMYSTTTNNIISKRKGNRLLTEYTGVTSTDCL